MQLFDEIDQVTTDYRRVVLGIEDDDEPDFGSCAECGCPACEYNEYQEDFLCEPCVRQMNKEYRLDCAADDPRHEPRS